MSLTAKYSLTLKGKKQEKELVSFTCSHWLANRVFVSLCYALNRGAEWDRVELNHIGKLGTKRLNGCTLKGLDFDHVGG